MALPTSQNEVTTRKLGDTISGLWGKIKDTFQTKLTAQTAYSGKGTATKVPQITTNSLGQVTSISEVTITGVTPASHATSDTTYGAANKTNYGHVKLVTGDVNDVTYTAGVAASPEHTHSQYAPKASPALTGTPTAPTAAAGTNTTQIATTAFVKQAVVDGMAESDAMIYKGTISGSTSSATYGGLTPAASKGHTYKVTTAGKVNNIAVEVGDMLICNTDDTAAATSSNYSTIAANWDYVQTNLDGVVVGPGSATSGNIALFDGTSGKLLKNSSYSPSSFAGASHSHGNITNAGAIGSTSGNAVYTTSNGVLTAGSLAVSSPSVPSSGTTKTTAFIDTVSQDAKGQITATKKNVDIGALLDTFSASTEDLDGNGQIIAAKSADVWKRHRVSTVWSYIKGKIADVLGLYLDSSNNKIFSGNSATATTATNATNANLSHSYNSGTTAGESVLQIGNGTAQSCVRAANAYKVYGNGSGSSEYSTTYWELGSESTRPSLTLSKQTQTTNNITKVYEDSITQTFTGGRSNALDNNGLTLTLSNSNAEMDLGLYSLSLSNPGVQTSIALSSTDKKIEITDSGKTARLAGNQLVLSGNGQNARVALECNSNNDGFRVVNTNGQTAYSLTASDFILSGGVVRLSTILDKAVTVANLKNDGTTMLRATIATIKRSNADWVEAVVHFHLIVRFISWYNGTADMCCIDGYFGLNYSGSAWRAKTYGRILYGTGTASLYSNAQFAVSYSDSNLYLSVLFPNNTSTNSRIHAESNFQLVDGSGWSFNNSITCYNNTTLPGTQVTITTLGT